MPAALRHRPRRAPTWWRLPALTVALTMVLAACGSEAPGADQASSGQLSIVATTTVLADAATQVAGDAAEVTPLMESGADPHNFEPSARQLAELQEADLIVANGGDLEEQLAASLTEAERAGVPVFHALDHVPDTLTFDGTHDPHADQDAHASEDHAAEGPSESGHADDGDHETEGDHADAPEDHASEAEGDGHGHDGGAVDPHFWTDPTRMVDVVDALGAQIAGLAVAAGAVEQRADDYVAQLERTDAQIDEALAAVPDDRRTLVTNHEAFGYFADRYDFAIVGTVIPSLTTGAEPSAQDIEELSHTIAEQQVPAIFAENTAPAQLAETLAQEVGDDVQVVELYSDSVGPSGSGADTYTGMLEANAATIAEALGG